MAHSSEPYTYKGYWINWSHGAIFGSTITLSTRYGGLLTAFLAIYVTLAGAASWSIMSYILHQCRAKQEMQDAMHHQQQLIFRNTTSPAEAAWQFVQIAFHWRKCAKKPLLRSLPIGLLALLNLVLFGLASIFSSEVTRSSGNETLIRSPNCGVWTTDSDFKDVMSPGGVAYRSKLLNDALAASEYATACYNNSTDILRCNQFITQQIPWNVNQNASCPFASNLCIFGPASAYEMDTGPIDSQLVLGINAPASARITTRKLTTCSPIRTKGYTQVWNVTDPTLRTYGNTYIKLYFGEISGVTNFTHAYNTNMELMDTDYVLTSFIFYGNRGNDLAWIPHPDLIRKDADVSLFLLAANSVYYDGPVSDPFFSANIQRETVGEETQYWAPDYYITALACIDQYQLCNPSNHLCTNLNSSNSIFASALQLGLTSRQNLSASRIGLSAATLSMFSSTEGRGKSALRASETLFDRIQIALPDNQWMIEVSSWMAISLARLQYLTVQFATGPQKMPSNSHIVKPSSATGILACKSQKVRNATGTISFSVLGLSIILTIGGFLIITSLFLSHIINFIGRKFHIADYKCIQWALDEKFQLQRLAYEEAGQGTWSGALSAVPITKTGEVIGIPNGIDRDHPRLSKSREESGGLLESSKAQATFEKNRPGLQIRTISSDLSHR